MALVQYSERGVPVAVHVTAAEREQLKRHAYAVDAVGQMLSGLRVYVTPPTRTLRWYDRAASRLRTGWQWIMRRWREWKARIEAPEREPRKMTATPFHPNYRVLWPTPYFKPDAASCIHIVSS